MALDFGIPDEPETVESLRSEVEALRKRNEELEREVQEEKSAYTLWYGSVDDADAPAYIDKIKTQLSAAESRAQEAETKLKAAEDCVLALRKPFEDEEREFSSKPYPTPIGPAAFFRRRMVQELLENTNLIATQRKRKIVREALERAIRMMVGLGCNLNFRQKEAVIAAILNPTEPA